MIKTVLVPAAGDMADLATFSIALRVAQWFGAHIDALHVRPEAVDSAFVMTWGMRPTPLAEDLIEEHAQLARAPDAKVRRIFEDFCARERLPIVNEPPPAGATAASAQLHLVTGDEARSMVAYGLAADLIIAPREDKGHVTARSVLASALLETGRPVLIPGAAPTWALPDTIAIAWKPSPQAARAVTAAMPFLVCAKEVIVMTVGEGDGPGNVERLVRNLAWHGIRATSQHLESIGLDAAETLLAEAKGRAELLVMGGYGHGRLREWTFGGFTRRVLAGAPLPVLMVH